MHATIRRRMAHLLASCAIAAITLFSTPVMADGGAAVHGHVTVNGAARAGVVVTAAGEAPAQQVRTDESGAFSFGQLPPGRYTFTAHVDGLPDAVSTLNVTGADRDIALDVGVPPQIGGASVNRGAPLGATDLSSTVITRRQLEENPQSSVDQILNRVTGVYTPQVPAGEVHPTAQIVSIRGFGSAFGVRTLVLLDGIPINDGYFRTVDWSQIPKSSIERIEVIRGGGATSLWGNLASGGVINIVTRAAARGDYHAEGSYGSFNTFGGSLGGTVLSTDALSLGVNLDTTSTSGYNLTPAQFQNPSNVATSSHANDAMATAFFTPANGTLAYVRGFAHKVDESGLVWSQASNAWSKYTLQGGITRQFSETQSLNVYAWWDNAEFDTQNATNPGYTLAAPQLGTPYISQIEALHYNTLGGSAVLNLKGATFGVDLRRTSAVDHNALYNAAAANTALVNNQGSHQFEGLFAQTHVRPGEGKLDVTAGLREDFWQAVNGNISGQTLSGFLSNPLPNNTFVHFDPRLGATYALTGSLGARAVAYENFAAPGMNQMYRSYVSGSTYNNSSPNLIPETNTGEELGLDYKRPGINGSFTAYRNAILNYIDYPTLCSSAAACAGTIAGTGLTGITSVRQYLNVGSARIQGFEVLVGGDASQNVRLNGGFTTTQARLTNTLYPAIDPLGQQIGQVPGYTINVGGTWRAGRTFDLTMQTKSFPGYWYDTAHTVRNDAATVVDLGLTYHVSSTFDVYVDGRNVGNDIYYAQGASGTTTAPTLAQPSEVSVGVRAAR